MTTLEYRLHFTPAARITTPRTAMPQPYPRHASRPAAARPEAQSTCCGHGTLLNPEGELAEQTRRYQLKREAAEAISRTHLPVWRWRLVILCGILPIVWMFARCQVEGCRRWPCGPLLARLHEVYGWGPQVDAQIKALSTKRRRAKAARRSPTAVSHRAKPRRRGKAQPENRCGSR